jgi:hypothetical protein
MWSISTTDAPSTAFEKYGRRHPAEVASVFANLDTLLAFLRAGRKVGAFRVGWFRSEGKGVYRIGQTAVPRAHETRLYVCIDDARQLVHVIGLGDKSSQDRDIRAAHVAAGRLLVTEGGPPQ